jgi:F-type H+-transporting ATPase subunit epsilon
MAALKCIVVTPEKTALEQDASFVVVPLYDGEFGVGKGHSPTIGRLGFGELRITAISGQVNRYYVDGGFAQIADDVVTLLTGRITPAAELNEQVAKSQLDEAMQRPVNTDELLMLRDRAVEQARSQIRIASRAKG